MHVCIYILKFWIHPFCWMQASVMKSYPPKLLFVTLQCFLSSIQSFAIAIALERDPYQWKLGWNVRLVAVAYCVIKLDLFYFLINFFNWFSSIDPLILKMNIINKVVLFCNLIWHAGNNCDWRYILLASMCSWEEGTSFSCHVYTFGVDHDNVLFRNSLRRDHYLGKVIFSLPR